MSPWSSLSSLAAHLGTGRPVPGFQRLHLPLPNAARSSVGMSKSHANTHRRALDLFDQHIQLNEKRRAALPQKWSQFTAAQLCRADVWSGFGEFLSEEHIIAESDRGGGHHLAIGTQLDYLGAALNQAAAKFKATGDDATKLFFTCLDPKASTEAACWLRQLKGKMVRTAMQRAKDNGEELDKSVTPIYGVHVRAAEC